MRWDRVVMGATLIAIGVLFLLDRADVLDAGRVIGDWWPAVLVGFGLVTLAERPVSLLGPVLLVAVGVLLLLVTNDVLETSAWNVIWPAALIAFGLTVLVRNSRRGDHLVLGEGHDQDLVRTTAFLSGSELASQSNAFRGAVLTAIMEGVELDMRHATLAEDGAEVDATAIMGGVDLIIPRDWRVTVRGTPILGGVSNRAEGSSLPDDAPRLRVDALAILGGVEIKHDKQMDKNDPSYKGQRGYNRFLLAIYDPWVIGFMTRAVWKVPVAPVVERYRPLIGRRHLDVGPGTGYFLEKAAPPDGTEITLLDPNPNVLRKASRRLAAMHPITVEADVMKPLPVDGPFDSAALSYVLHCLRGPQSNKAVAIRNIADVLAPDGVLFGGTVLGLEERHRPQARAVLRAFNWQGDFDNLGDTADGLRRILEESFERVEVDVVGSTANFAASGPRSLTRRTTRPTEGPEGSERK